MTWVFMDEREDSMNDGEMIVGMFGYPGNPGAWKIVDCPASYHNQAGGLSFADGHSEIKRWVDRRTFPVLKKGVEIPPQRGLPQQSRRAMAHGADHPPALNRPGRGR